MRLYVHLLSATYLLAATNPLPWKMCSDPVWIAKQHGERMEKANDASRKNKTAQHTLYVCVCVRLVSMFSESVKERGNYFGGVVQSCKQVMNYKNN